MVMTVTVDESSPLLSVNISVRGAAPASSRATDGEAVAHAEHVESRTEHAANDDDEEAPRHNNDNNNNNSNNNNDNNNNGNDNNNNNVPNNDNDNNNDDNGSQFLNRTRQRLRCLFVMFTCPIIPLVTALSMFLLWVLYAAFVDEDSSNCTKPLRTYAWMSVLLFMYTPNHRRVKRFLSSRHNSSNETNAAVDRMYDHLYITCCLFYLYVGVTWTNTCCEGGVGGVGGLDQTRNKGGGAGAGAESCYCGCRSLYYATHSFVLTLCVLATVLALPLLCLPCVYLWIVRGATEDALMDAYANHGGGGEAANALSDWSVGQVLDQMDRVNNAINMSTGSLSQQGRLGSLLSSSIKSSMDKLNKLIRQPDVECCICMNQLYDGNNGPIVRTNCGHLFHRKCLGSWLAGQQWDDENASAGAGSAPNTTRAVARRLCPLCREDLIPASCPLESSSASQQQQYQRADSFVSDSAGIVF